MTKRVQFIGHDFEEANLFIGDDREITVDYTNWELRLHDGATPGGFKILNRDQNDDRYQSRNTELDGLLGWEPSERGFVTRLGPGNYQLRAIAVVLGELTIQYPQGFEGNPVLGLPDEITSNILFSGDIDFSEPIAALGGVEGDLFGNSSGVHTGPQIGDVEGDVTGDLLGNTFGVHTGGLDTTGEGAVVVMAPGQIQLEWLSQEIIDFIVRAGLPVGSTIPYSGPLEDIPLNWYICDGTNGTPDLRNRFVIGTSATYPVDQTGGTIERTLEIAISESGAHSHGDSTGGHTLVTAEMPKHKHANGVADAGTALWFYGSTPGPQNTSDSIDNNGNSGTNQGWSSEVGGDQPHSHSLATDLGAHTHSGTIAGVNLLPPYYSLYYIMKGA